MEKEKFSWQKRKSSFRYAFSGLHLAFKTEHNAWLHLIATVLVIVLALWLRVSSTDGALLAVAIGLVWISELFNTCIEKMMDFTTTENHPTIKLIKDVSAGAVLTAALTAIAIGCFVFIPKIMYL
jgi:diacylglycerol kinase (ATP)